MKKWMKTILSAVLGISILAGAVPAQTALAAEEDMRAVWISTVYRADYPTAQNDIAAQKTEFIQKLDQAQALGLNTVVVQIRPKGDAFYESELNPWSEILTGTQGKDPGYDPMAFMIEETHKRGMEFHAWMNPYRITTSGTDLAALSADNMARQHPDWILTYNGAMYYNPAKEEVKQYIIDTVAEVVENYDVDAIHFDDYFYPSNYPLSEGETRDGQEANARREHVNDLIEGVYKKIKSIDSSVEFGISPMGIWKNQKSDSTGSATSGSEGYYTVYGDAKTWVKNGWVDYIVPQIYWETGNSAADYETLVKWWNDLVAGTGVDLYIGQGIYKDSVASEITKELGINEKYSNVGGSFYFSLRDLLNDRQGVATAVKNYYAAKDTVSQPEKEEDTPAVNPVQPSGNQIAYAGRANLQIDGTAKEMDIYIINDYSYFKLRDIARSITGTKKQFDTVWIEDTQSIHLQTGIPYTINGTESVSAALSDTTAYPSTAKLYVDGEAQSVAAYTINDYTYYKLRDIAALVDFGVTWDESTFTIGIVTSSGYDS
ncbi:family 10 glycosylhydrolase [Anaerotignum lactatifermentans]|uniref:Family 10 glycosylhydrolase n=1 Tax=Anaerotignum lactatifermentans TaxID=160404 RepID=A0ABS2G728_9FIRM|nr:family 10 glycosylhydrolase [Anaerotignum lactatifermentans]MBM6828832.1 family 10 glycosylhydrolase [Anaerotignum lactatifermentans]MBM6876995.1 family 10 glycosylhydrolase [Anaerotignum lactatifermentans]MBM6950553.1 family 10 glycosylhydrolase [Anaerotignum lactatifermentans]